MNETAFNIDSPKGPLVAILHRPVASAKPSRLGVVMIVGGGPQYRVGGHRQLTLWSRRLAAAGIPVLRFDHLGMGDSPGEYDGFTVLDDDIRCAIDRLVAECPEVREAVLWGECSAASAALYYAYRDPRVSGAVLLNLWVRTKALAAQATLRYYYLQRLLQPSLWRKLFSGRFNPLASVKSAYQLVQEARSGEPEPTRDTHHPGLSAAIPRSLPLTKGLLMGLSRFKGRVMLVQSGRDMIAREFDVVVNASPAWRAALARCDTQRHDMADGDHTFSSAVQRDQVITWALQWLAEKPVTVDAR